MNYYIQGDAANADKIKAAFEKLGYDTTGWKFDVEGGFYYTTERKRIDFACGNFLINLIKTHPDYQELPLPIEPKFKAKDRIVNKSDKSTIYRIIALHEEFRKYIVDIEHKVSYESCPWIAFEDQDDYELAPKPHYDIANFKPFDKVLVRDGNREKWQCALFSNYDKEQPYSFITTGDNYKQCIPFEGNEHLLGTTDMCDEMYINW